MQELAIIMLNRFDDSVAHAGIWCALFAAIFSLLQTELFAGVWYAALALGVVVAGLCTTLLSIARQPRAPPSDSFQAPFSPFMPGVSILINVYLMFQLDSRTWQRYAVWIAIGLAIYFGYGMWNSDERRAKKEEQVAARSSTASTKSQLQLQTTKAPLEQ